MTTTTTWIEAHHKGTIAVLGAVILFFAASCLFHEAIPICHWLFGCDHGMHMLSG